LDQAASIRHASDGTQPKPPSISTTFSFGNRSKMPSKMKLDTCVWNAVD
jgi:hypothetical protein